MAIGEIDIYGVYLSTLLASACVAYFLQLAIKRLLGISGFYNLVWHRALFDIALFVIIIGLLLAAAEPGQQLVRGLIEASGNR